MVDIPHGGRIITTHWRLPASDSGSLTRLWSHRPDGGTLRKGRVERCRNCLCGGEPMDFYDVLDQVLDLLRQRGRVTYNALKRLFGLDDACLQDLEDEIIEAQR